MKKKRLVYFLKRQAKKIFSILFVASLVLAGSQNPKSVYSQEEVTHSANNHIRVTVLTGLENLRSEVVFPANNGIYRLNQVEEFNGTAIAPQGLELDRIDVSLKRISGNQTLYWNGTGWQQNQVWLPTIGKENWRKLRNPEQGANWSLPTWEVGVYYNIVSRAKIMYHEVYEDVSQKQGNTFRFTDDNELRIIPRFVVLEVGAQFQFQAVGGTKIQGDPDGYNWSSPQSAVGFVNGSGIFTATGIGSTTVTVSDASNPVKQDTATVVVIERQQDGLILIPKYSLIYEGDTVNFIALDNQTGLDYCWKEDNEGSLRYGEFLEGDNQANYTRCTRNGDNTNVFRGLSAGITKVRVTNSLGQTDTAKVVISKRTRFIDLIPEYASIKVGETQQYQVIGGVQPFTWTSTEEDIASVNQIGLARGLKEGHSLIVVKDAEGNYDVGLLRVYVDGDTDYFRLIPHSAILPAACSNLRFSTDGGRSPFMWGSSNNTVGVVDTTGFFMPLYPGNTKITVKDKIDRYRHSFVGVTDGYPRSKVEIVPGSLTLYVNETFKFQAKGGPSSTYTWEVTDTEIGEIDQQGNFRAKSVGQTSVVVKSGSETDVAPVLVFDPTKPPTDYKFTVAPGFAVILMGDKTNFKVLGEHRAPITWTITNEEIATIDQNGVVTPKKEGRATVIATDANGARAFATIGVIEDCSDTLRVIPPYSEVYPGDQIQMQAEGGKAPYVWYSTRTLIATIDKDSGLVTAQNPGITVIYVMDGLGRTGYAIVKVLDPKDKEFRVVPPEAIIAEGTTFQFRTVNGEGKIKWEVSDPKYASINENGVLTALKKTGDKWITITATDEKGRKVTARVKIVAGNPKEGIAVNPESATLYVGQWLQLSYGTDCEIENGKIRFISLNPEVAVVDQNGRVTAVSEGYATIRLTDFCGNSKDVKIRVINYPKPKPRPNMPKTGSSLSMILLAQAVILASYYLVRKRKSI